MVTVSQMSGYKLYYKFDKQISCEKICQDLSKMLEKFVIDNPNSPDTMMVLEIKSTSYDDTTMIPKLEHKN